MRCLIVDDDEMARKSLELLAEKIDSIEIVGVCESATEALEYLQKNDVDLLFLDVEMPSISGVDLVRSLDNLPLIIFITAKREYAADAFEFRELVVDYITKPVTLPRLLKSVQRAQQQFSQPLQSTPDSPGQQRDYIFIRTDGKLVRIDLDKLLYLETVGDYVLFKTDEKQYLVHSTLKSMDGKIDNANFMKVHRSYIINLSKIVDVQDGSVLIAKKIIPVSRANRQTLLERLNPL